MGARSLAGATRNSTIDYFVGPLLKPTKSSDHGNNNIHGKRHPGKSSTPGINRDHENNSDRGNIILRPND